MKKLDRQIEKELNDAMDCYMSYTTAPKQVEYINWTFNRAKIDNNTSLFDCYSRPSYAKEKAFNYCRKLCDTLKGHDLYIAGYNSQLFTVVFRFTHPTTAHECIAFITKDHDRFCDLTVQ